LVAALMAGFALASSVPICSQTPDRVRGISRQKRWEGGDM